MTGLIKPGPLGTAVQTSRFTERRGTPARHISGLPSVNGGDTRARLGQRSPPGGLETPGSCAERCGPKHRSRVGSGPGLHPCADRHGGPRPYRPAWSLERAGRVTGTRRRCRTGEGRGAGCPRAGRGARGVSVVPLPHAGASGAVGAPCASAVRSYRAAFCVTHREADTRGSCFVLVCVRSTVF